MTTDPKHRAASAAVNVGLGANVVLAALKTFIGIVGHSQAMLADGINSTSDVAYYIVVKIFMRLARKPADAEHPYGHSQLESIAALVVGSFVITTAVAVFWDAFNEAYDVLTGAVARPGVEIAALWVALFTIAAKLALTAYTRRVGRRVHNAALLALAYDHRNDVVSAAGAALGIVLALSGLPWADPVVGAGVALVILRTGIQILRESSADLMDTVPGRELDGEVRAVLAPVAGLGAVEEIHAHRFGPYLVLNVTIAVDGGLSVAAGDAIATAVERALTQSIGFVRKVYVHYHPAAFPPSS
jgi:cation diffusion facilitator family transporter